MEATWVKQNESFRKKESVQRNQQLQYIKQGAKTSGEGSRIEKNELQVWHDSPKSSELTRHSDLVKGCQIKKALQKSDIILGSSKDPKYQGILAEWSPKTRTVYQIKSNALALPGGQSQWNKSLALSNQYVNDPAVNKGKRILECSEEEVKDKMEDLELMNQIYEGIHEISPGNWGDDGFGPVANENYLKLALFPESVANVSTIINKIEKKKKGYSFGSCRLTLFKRAARRKHVLEITRMALEDHLIVERGIDPYGLNLNCNPTLVVANDPMLSEEPHCLAFEETVCSSSADDSMENFFLQKRFMISALPNGPLELVGSGPILGLWLGLLFSREDGCLVLLHGCICYFRIATLINMFEQTEIFRVVILGTARSWLRNKLQFYGADK
ncbi:hypothetical protein GQ457_01G018800 [Hibiscus cannabinus]